MMSTLVTILQAQLLILSSPGAQWEWTIPRGHLSIHMDLIYNIILHISPHVSISEYQYSQILTLQDECCVRDNQIISFNDIKIYLTYVATLNNVFFLGHNISEG